MCYSLPCSSGLASINILLCTNRLLFRIVERGVDRWNPCLSGFHGSKSVFSWSPVCGVLSAQSLFCALASTDILLRKMVYYFKTVEWFVCPWNPCVRCFVKANLCLFGTRSMVFPLTDFDKTSYTILFRMSFVTFAFFFFSNFTLPWILLPSKNFPPIFEHCLMVRFEWISVHRETFGMAFLTFAYFSPYLQKISPYFFNTFPLSDLDKTFYMGSFWDMICDVCIFFSKFLIFPSKLFH